MLQWERGRVLDVRAPWAGVQTLRLEVEGVEGEVPALSYPELLGEIAVGEGVLVNSNALRRGLGTGGQALVVARTDELPRDAEPHGHMVKARYTPMQTLVDALDDPASPHREALEQVEDLGGMPVVLADLHSALPAIVAGIRATRPDARIAYVMSDAAALPAAYSRTVAQLRANGELAACISSGQAFGGDLEAVTVHSALLGAKAVVGADVAVVTQGPGNLGTDTTWGFSGIQAAEALHAATALGGAPIAALRVSGADARSRHVGLSHHSATLLGRAALAPADIPVPRRHADAHVAGSARRNSAEELSVEGQLETAVLRRALARGVRHRRVEVPAEDLLEVLGGSSVPLRTMGRGLSEDPAPFVYAAVAGRRAAQVVPSIGTGAEADERD
ncbi:DUF3866 domain-containing protein [Brachybacterium endophyticum]|uniref:DUF3866 domain-containing protein n=1 Tax=Brachybacterium endophyticum TaxID=2182385 RepID=A0A2U2RIK2_9MICO|nr:DUF3866 family protein [Brachybacterium endophyticum]PWH05686.1 DUF3866 domain-containing protein [Brachybacterium endophyticum]